MASQDDIRPRTTAALPVRARPLAKQEIEDPRGFQIAQICRRFKAHKTTDPSGGAFLQFKAPVTDPDFPFELDALDCSMTVPADLMNGGAPSLKISNKVMERGYQVNVEKGFDAIWAAMTAPTLLNAMKALDTKLEAILTAQKAEIFRIVTNASSKPVVLSEPSVKMNADSAASSTSATAQKAAAKKNAEPSIAQKDLALGRRQAETRTLEQRLGRDPKFSSTTDKTIFILPLQPRKASAMPAGLQGVDSIRLYVPMLYNIEPCSMELIDAQGEEARNIEASFSRRVLDAPDATLVMHLNYLTQNIHRMTTPPKAIIVETNDGQSGTLAEKVDNPAPFDTSVGHPELSIKDTEKTHVKVIARPPEWDVKERELKDSQDKNSATSASEDDSSYSDDTDDESDVLEHDLEDHDQQNTAPKEQGTMLSFPSLEMHNIELLELYSANLQVKCERCKDVQDIRNLKNNAKQDYTGIASASCKKCANSIGVGFRSDLMHMNSIRAGFFDIDGATALDLLPSSFLATCAECSTTTPAPGITSVRGDSSMTVCRECHKKMSFKMPDTKFLRISAAAIKTHHGLPRRKVKENLGIVAGTELPKRGRCQHYSKSHRWFRFSCCAKVYPCDECHDAVEKDHVQEFANRMICGFCSKEQNYRPEDCAFCRRTLTGKATSGFWEGGKGTRDRAKMSRKDPRKYRNRTGHQSTSKTSEKKT